MHRKTITWTNDDLLSVGLGTHFMEVQTENKSFFHEN